MTNASHRILPESGILKKEDYLFGFGINSSFYNQVRQARENYNASNPPVKLPVREDFTEDYDTRDGYAIDGKKLNTRHHPLQDIRLLEKETGKVYLVTSVHKHNDHGYYMTLIIHAEGSNSHGVVWWENISCFNPTILDGIKSAHERFIIIK